MTNWFRTSNTYQAVDDPSSGTPGTRTQVSTPLAFYSGDHLISYERTKTGFNDGVYLWHAEWTQVEGQGGSIVTFSWRYTQTSPTAKLEVSGNGGATWETRDRWGPLEPPEKQDLPTSFILEDITTPGTLGAVGRYEVEETFTFDGLPQGSPATLGTFDLRMLVIDNLRPQKKKIHPNAEQHNSTPFLGDILALPASTDLFPNGWQPSGPVEWMVKLLGEEFDSGTASVSAPDANGKVASFTSKAWNGRDFYPYYEPDAVFESVVPGTAYAMADVPITPAGGGNTQAPEAEMEAMCSGCPRGEKGAYALQFVLMMFDNAAGPSMNPILSYNSFQHDFQPASLGYGWSSNSSIRIFEDGNELIFKSAAGGYLRWKKVGSDYVPLRENNFVKAEKFASTYELTFKDYTRMEFDSQGRITKEIDRNGNYVRYTYNGSGHLDKMQDDKGRVVTYEYGTRTDGQPTRIVSPGRAYVFDYDGIGDPAPDHLSRIIDPNGDEVTFYHNAEGLIQQTTYIRPTLGDLSVICYYDDFGRLTEKRVPLQRWYYSYDDYFDATSYTTIEHQDLTSTEPSRFRHYSHDFRGLLTEMTELVQFGPSVYNDVYLDYDDPNPFLVTKRTQPNGATTDFTYTADGNIKTITDAQGNVTTFDYPEDVDVLPIPEQKKHLVRKMHRPEVTVNGTPTTYDPTEFEYDGNGRLIKIIDAAGEETIIAPRTDGQPSSITDRRGQVTTFTYKSDGNLETVVTPSGPGLAPARTTTFTTDSHDNVTGVQDNDGNVWTYDFDDTDRLTKITDARSKVTEFDFLDGELEEILAPANAGSAGSSRATNYSYDTAGRLSQVDSDISASTQETRVAYEYNSFAEVLKLKRLMNSVYKATEYSYDRLGRQVTSKDPLNRTSTMDYEPFCTGFTETTARGIVRDVTFDTLCRMTSVESGDETREFFYDELSRLVKVKQVEKTRYGKRRFGSPCYRECVEERLFEYDPLDRLTKVTFPDGETILYEYGKEGELLKMTDTNGKVTRYTYLNDLRLHEVIIERPSQSDRIFTYSYDAAGRLEKIEYPAETGSTSPIEARFYGTAGAATEPGWDENGNLLRLFYHRDGSRIQSFEYAYDDSGNRISLVDTPANTANKVTWEYGYDWLDRLVEVKRGVGAATPVITSLYTYDESDNRTEWELPAVNETYSYSYNVADELEEIELDTGSGAVLFESFTSDDDGNLTSRTLAATSVTTVYEFNPFNKLTAITVGSSTPAVNKYDAVGGRKLRVADDGLKQKSFYSGLPTASEEDTDGNTISWLMGHLLMGFEKNGDFFYALHDGLSSIRILTDSTGATAAGYEFDEFGGRIATSETGGASMKTYVGGHGVTDEASEVGLLYMLQRWMDPKLGRFISRDPIGYGGGLNLYTYSKNDPVGRIDPSGLSPVDARISFIRAEIFRRANNKKCREAVNRLRSFCPSDLDQRTDIPREKVFDAIFKLSNVTYQNDPTGSYTDSTTVNQPPREAATPEQIKAHPELAMFAKAAPNRSTVTIGGDIGAGTAPISDVVLETVFHEMLHLTGVGHSTGFGGSRQFVEGEAFMIHVARVCLGTSGHHAGLRYPGTALYWSGNYDAYPSLKKAIGDFPVK